MNIRISKIKPAENLVEKLLSFERENVHNIIAGNATQELVKMLETIKTQPQHILSYFDKALSNPHVLFFERIYGKEILHRAYGLALENNSRMTYTYEAGLASNPFMSIGMEYAKKIIAIKESQDILQTQISVLKASTL